MRAGNKVKPDENGYVTGTISEVNYKEAHTDVVGKKEVKYSEQAEIVIKCKGSQSEIKHRIWVGFVINSEKYPYESSSKEKIVDYNKATRLCLNLGLIKETDLESDIIPEIDLETIVGTKIKYKLEPSKKSPSLKVPVLSSIIPVK